MQSPSLTINRDELLGALKLLGVTRRRRFSSVVPVWLKYEPGSQRLEISEDKATVSATVPANGTWPPMGATVDLYLLRRAVAREENADVELCALSDSVLVHGDGWMVRLELLEFGPPEQPFLPLFDGL